MTQTLKTFLANRKAEIKKQIAALKVEYREIQAAEQAVAAASPAASNGATKGRSDIYDTTTIKGMVMAVMQDFPNGADAIEIVEAVKSQFGKDIKRESMSPQLSRLRHDDKVLDLKGGKWVAIEKKEAPEGASDLV